MEVVKLKTPLLAEAASIRELPHNIEAEQSLIGLLLINNGYYGQVNEILLSEHFFEPLHQRIFAAISKLIERGQVATPIVLKSHFDKDAALEDIGGAKYLTQLAQMAVQIVDIRELARLIHDLAIKRKLIEIGENVVITAFKPDLDKNANQQIEEAEHSLFTLATVGDISRGFVPLATPVKEALDMSETAMKRTKRVAGITTGFIDMDNLLGGLNNSDLLILAARPSMGKTALAVNIAYNAVLEIQQENKDEDKKGCVGIFSLEMSAPQLTTRLLSMGVGADAGIDSNRIRKGDINEDEFARLIRRSRVLSELPLFIDDTPALSISQIRTRARRLQRQHGLRLLVVDYLQLLHSSARRANDSRVQEISEITQGLKAIAKELNIPVIALSQLSRAVETREDKRPQLSDLRESGSIEQDADVVMFIYREEYYLVRKQPPEEKAEEHAKWQVEMEAARNITEIFVAKQRNGPVDKIKLRFDGATTMFQNLAEDGV